MSTLTEQITAKCLTIADNQKRVYELGFKEGGASVKHIYFSILYHDTYFCAFSGMTWREYVASNFNRNNFSIKENAVFYSDTAIDTGADDVIVEDGIYVPLYPFEVYDGENTYALYRGEEWGIAEFVDSGQNTIGLYIDEAGDVRTSEGNYFYIAKYGDEGHPIVNGEYGWLNSSFNEQFKYYYEFITERKADCEFAMSGYSDRCWCTLGMTWQEYANSKFADAIAVTDSEIYHVYGSWSGLTLNGVKVLPSDVIVKGATYEIVTE